MVPAHNAAAHIASALASIHGQSLPAEEVVVCDDGSTDDTAGTVRRWECVLPVRLLRNLSPEGPARARQQAIEAARTQLVALLDADDVWLPDHLQSMADSLTEPVGTALASARMLLWMPGRGLAPDVFPDIPPPERQHTAILTRNFIRNATLFPVELFGQVGGYRTGYRWGEDWDLWIRMVRAGATVVGPSHPTALYRRHPGTLTWDDASGLEGELAMLSQVAREVQTPDERRAVRQGLRSQRAAVALRRAYRQARAGHSWPARAAALPGLLGQRRVAARAAFMLLAPRFGVRQRDTRFQQPRYWLTR